MMYDPEPNECAGCLRKISAPNVWLCDTCVQVAVELGYEATPYHHPGDEVTKILWDKAMERQRAETEKRRHGTGQTHREDPA
jgi:hypothetical protein